MKVEHKERGLLFYSHLQSWDAMPRMIALSSKTPAHNKQDRILLLLRLQKNCWGKQKPFPGLVEGSALALQPKLGSHPRTGGWYSFFLHIYYPQIVKEYYVLSPLTVIRASAICIESKCNLHPKQVQSPFGSADCEGLLWQGGDHAAGPDGGSADRHGAKRAAAGL